MKAKQIPDWSIVKLPDGRVGAYTNKGPNGRPTVHVRAAAVTAVEVKFDDEMEVVKYPAEIAMAYAAGLPGLTGDFALASRDWNRIELTFASQDAKGTLVIQRGPYGAWISTREHGDLGPWVHFYLCGTPMIEIYQHAQDDLADIRVPA
jgi:hypothetical protein